MLLCVGSRCWTMTKAMPLSGGMAERRSMKALRPPADAPIPTTGKVDRERWYLLDFIRVNSLARMRAAPISDNAPQRRLLSMHRRRPGPDLHKSPVDLGSPIIARRMAARQPAASTSEASVQGIHGHLADTRRTGDRACVSRIERSDGRA